MDDYVNTAVQTSRGCPHACEFCDVTALFGRVPRYKGPEQVIAELERLLYRIKAPRHVFICDDNFIADRSRARAILEAIIDWNRDRGEPFGFDTQCTVELGRDREMIDLLTAANFGQVFVGVESPDEEALVRARKTQNVRRPFVDLIDTICRNGLTVLPSFVVGLDGESKGVGRRICELVEETAAPVAMINLLQALPHTRLWERLEREGRLRRDFIPEEETFGLPNFIPDRPLEEVLSEFTGTWDYLYEPRRFLARTYRYYLAMRPTRKAMAESRGERYTAPKQRRGSLRRELLDLRALLIVVWRQGILAPYRRQFWSQWLGMMRQNPSRVNLYLDPLRRRRRHVPHPPYAPVHAPRTGDPRKPGRNRNDERDGRLSSCFVACLKPVRQGPIRLAVLLQDLKFGGTQRQAIELARGLDPKRYRVELWVLMGGLDLLPAAESFGIPVVRLGRGGYVWPPDLFRLWMRLRAHPVDILFLMTGIPNIWGRLLGRLTGVPLIVGACRDHILWHERFLGRLAHHHVCNSYAIRRYAMEKYHLPEEHMTVIPNGVDLEQFHGRLCRRVEGPPPFRIPAGTSFSTSAGW